jgi:hypothetical protein
MEKTSLGGLVGGTSGDALTLIKIDQVLSVSGRRYEDQHFKENQLEKYVA